ncbi:hypothetical protein HDU89_001566 [Geranomyces variabilis]|nr:hypothetical protein HDU89_001566 [Geranomyces variabilis]
MWEDYCDYVRAAAAATKGATGALKEENAVKVHKALTCKSEFERTKVTLEVARLEVARQKKAEMDLAKLAWQSNKLEGEKNKLAWETTQHVVGLTGKRPPPKSTDSSPLSSPVKRRHLSAEPLSPARHHSSPSLGTPPVLLGPAASPLTAGRKGLGAEGGSGSLLKAADNHQTPPAVPSTMTPARPELDEDVPPTDAEIAHVHAELEGMQQDVGGVDISNVLRAILRQAHRRDLIEQNGVMHLAFHKCLLLSEAMPAAFTGACSQAQWSSMRSVFEKRVLVRNKEYGGKDLECLAEKWEKAVRAGAKLHIPKIDRTNDAACRLLACVAALSQHLGLEDAAPMSEPTWTLKLFAPYMSLVADSMLTIKYDERTPYSDKRPDVQASFGTRVAACGEIKSMWAKATDMKKDQSRAVRAAVEYMAQDAARLTLANNPVRLAMWSPGKEMYAYEVIRYPCGLAIAVEIARFDLPVAIRRGTVAQVAHAIGWFSAVAARIDHIKRRMEADLPLDL